MRRCRIRTLGTAVREKDGDRTRESEIEKEEDPGEIRKADRASQSVS